MVHYLLGDKDIKTYKFSLYLNILLLLLASSIFSQGIGTLRGVISDSTNGEALAFGNILIKELGTGASTDSKGYFIITSLPVNRNYTAIVSYIGYQRKSIDFMVLPGKVTHIDIQLSPSGVELAEVQKVGKRVVEKNETDIGLQRIAIRELEALPKGVETDIFRSLQYMPGVQTTGDVSAKFYVRGGASNQNLILLDNVPIYNPFHALGLFSVIDPEMIKQSRIL